MTVDILSFGHSTDMLVGNLIWRRLMKSRPEIVAEIFSYRSEVHSSSSVYRTMS